MMKTMRASVILLATLSAALLPASAQSLVSAPAAPKPVKQGQLRKFSFGLNFTEEMVKVSTTDNPWLAVPGGSAQGIYDLGRNLALEVDVNGENRQNLRPHVNLSEVTLVAGPRYTLWKPVPNSHRPSVYCEGLAGYVFAFDGLFPTDTTVGTNAGSFAMQVGGGITLPLNSNVTWNVVQADYVRTTLPNNSNNYQANTRFSSGFIFHFTR